MAVHFYEKEIASKDVIDLISILDKEEDDYIDLYFCSPGGCSSAAIMLIDYLNQHYESIILVPHFQIASAAFLVVMRTRCKKRFLPDVFGMIHLIGLEIDTRDMMDKASQDSFQHELLIKENKELLNELKDVLTEQELKSVENGKDVYLDYDRMLKSNKIYQKRLNNQKQVNEKSIRSKNKVKS